MTTTAVSSKGPLPPLALLKKCVGKDVSIELANGETVNGTVVRADAWMNIAIRNAIRTSADGAHFWRARECLVRGSGVVTVRMDPAVLLPPKHKRIRGGQKARSASAADAGTSRGRGRGTGRGRGRADGGAGKRTRSADDSKEKRSRR